MEVPQTKKQQELQDFMLSLQLSPCIFCYTMSANTGPRLRAGRIRREMSMELLKLVAVFLTIVIALAIKPVIRGRRKKVPLSLAILAGILVAALLYGIGPLRVVQLALTTIT